METTSKIIRLLVEVCAALRCACPQRPLTDDGGVLLQVKRDSLFDKYMWQVRSELVEAALHNARAKHFGSTWVAVTDVKEWCA